MMAGTTKTWRRPPARSPRARFRRPVTRSPGGAPPTASFRQVPARLPWARPSRPACLAHHNKPWCCVCVCELRRGGGGGGEVVVVVGAAAAAARPGRAGGGRGRRERGGAAAVRAREGQGTGHARRAYQREGVEGGRGRDRAAGGPEHRVVASSRTRVEKEKSLRKIRGCIDL